MSSAPASNQILITANNRGPSINLATWITLCAMVLSVLTKIASKFQKLGRVKTDDYIMASAMVSTGTMQQTETTRRPHTNTILPDNINRSIDSRVGASNLWPRPAH
jgi:hypothetical protein